jgi:hypothetical protein
MLWVRLPLKARCTTLCDKVCQWLAAVLWFSPCNPVSSTNKTDHKIYPNHQDEWYIYIYHSFIMLHFFVCQNTTHSPRFLISVHLLFQIILERVFSGWGLGVWCWTPLSTIFQLYRRGQFYWWRKLDYVGFTTTYAISAYHYWCCGFDSHSRRGVQHYVIKFVSDLRQFCGFHLVIQFPPPIKLTTTI